VTKGCMCSDKTIYQGMKKFRSRAPACGGQGGQAPTLEKIRVGIAHPGNFSRGLKTSWQ